MRKFIENLLYFSRPLLRILIRKPIYIFPFDGGTCSQISDYLCLKYCEENWGRVKIYADISWYEKNTGLEDSVIARPYNFEQLFDSLNFKKANKFQIWFYKLCFSYFQSKEDTKNGFSAELSQMNIPRYPAYLRGYYYLNVSLLRQSIERHLKFKNPQEFLDEKSLELYDEITKSEGLAVGVHVRRGDMAVEGGYWKVIPKEYFINITNIPELNEGRFYFFSEEPEWIEENVLPYIDVNAKIVKSNPSYYGYRDLFLLSSCDYQVKSQGSFGEFAYYLNNNKNKRLIGFNEKELNLWKWIE